MDHHCRSTWNTRALWPEQRSALWISIAVQAGTVDKAVVTMPTIHDDDDDDANN